VFRTSDLISVEGSESIGQAIRSFQGSSGTGAVGSVAELGTLHMADFSVLGTSVFFHFVGTVPVAAGAVGTDQQEAPIAKARDHQTGIGPRSNP